MCYSYQICCRVSSKMINNLYRTVLSFVKVSNMDNSVFENMTCFCAKSHLKNLTKNWFFCNLHMIFTILQTTQSHEFLIFNNFHNSFKNDCHNNLPGKHSSTFLGV